MFFLHAKKVPVSDTCSRHPLHLEILNRFLLRLVEVSQPHNQLMCGSQPSLALIFSVGTTPKT